MDRQVWKDQFMGVVYALAVIVLFAALLMQAGQKQEEALFQAAEEYCWHHPNGQMTGELQVNCTEWNAEHRPPGWGEADD